MEIGGKEMCWQTVRSKSDEWMEIPHSIRCPHLCGVSDTAFSEPVGWQ